jgi:hypothetical protein
MPIRELFDDLPPEVKARVVTRKRRRRPNRAFLDEEAAVLRGNPGKWAHITTCNGVGRTYRGDARSQALKVARQIRAGDLVSFAPKDSFDAVPTEDGEVWARFVGVVDE